MNLDQNNIRVVSFEVASQRSQDNQVWQVGSVLLKFYMIGDFAIVHTNNLTTLSNQICPFLLYIAKPLLIENDQCAAHAPSKTWTTNCATVGHSNTEMLFI